MTAVRPQVLYIVYWGAAEPLGQSLVLPAVKMFAQSGVDLTLVTFEKPADLARSDEMVEIKQCLERLGVRWIPLRYHKRPKVPATAFDIAQGLARSVAARLGARPDIIHARTFIGGLIGICLAELLGAKLVYHNEGFYPDEQVDAGVWQADSTPHRIARFLEHQMYSRADGIIALSNRAKKAIDGLPNVQRKATPVIVVSSCVDLNHFRLTESKPERERGILRLVYNGSVGGRYILDRIGRFVAAASRETGRVHLRVLSRAEPELVASMLNTGNLPEDLWSQHSVPYSAVPGELTDQQAGLMFLTQGISEHGCSPTKIGEYWAVGLPVITTPNVSDTEDIIRRERVGIIVREHSDDAYLSAVKELQLLLKDPELASRCRRAAETHYALEPACERQLALYRDLVRAK